MVVKEMAAPCLAPEFSFVPTIQNQGEAYTKLKKRNKVSREVTLKEKNFSHL